MNIVNSDDQIASIAGGDGPAGRTAGGDGYPRKRERTRRQLLTAGMAALAVHGPDGLTVGEIAGRAGVATGTFYNHFPSLAHLVEAITNDLAAGVEIARDLLDRVEHDPAARVAIGTRQLLQLTQADPLSARAFVSLLDTVPSFRTRVRATVHGAVEAGIKAGRFVDRSASITADAVLGAAVQWMRSRLTGEAGTEAEDDHLRMILTIVGLPACATDPVLDNVSTPTGATVER